MLYNQEEGLLKNGSLSARIYFLLLKKPSTVSELSKIIYNGKVQLANIIRVVNALKEGVYIEEYLLSRDEKIKLNFDTRTIYWKANYRPIIDYAQEVVGYRKKGSPSIKKEDLTEDDKKILSLILNSKWFSRFYEDNFLRTQQGEVIIYNNNIFSDTPIRFFAFILEELFSIRMTLQKFIKFKSDEKNLLQINDFDKYVEVKKSLIDEETKNAITKVIKMAKRSLGNYSETNISIDYFLRDYYILLIPYKLAEKLSTIGRVALTVYLHFNSAIDYYRPKY
jgi:hypothetical protein